MFNNPFEGKSYGMPFNQGDVVGVGYRHRTGTVFFTRNGRKIEDAYSGLRWNLFPTIGANGPCQVHVNLGQMGRCFRFSSRLPLTWHKLFTDRHHLGFVFIEANVKKWGLAPIQGTLAPPPAYGSERGSILLQTGVPRSSLDRSRHEGISESPLISLEHTSHIPHHQPPEYSSLPRQSPIAQQASDDDDNASDDEHTNSNENESDHPASSP
jgi:hypothetical protein